MAKTESITSGQLRTDVTINKKFTEYFVPTILTCMTNSLTVTIDALIVGNMLGENQLAAVNLVSPINVLAGAVSAMFAIGAGTVITRAMGENDREHVNRVFSSVIIGIIISSLIFTGLIYAFKENIIGMLAKDEALVPIVREYLSVFVFSFPANMLLTCMDQFVRADSRPRFASRAVITANASNLLLSVIFILFFNMGTAGAALGSVLGQLVGFVIILTHFRSENTLTDLNLQLSAEREGFSLRLGACFP